MTGKMDIITVTDIVWDTDEEVIEDLPAQFSIGLVPGLSDKDIDEEVYNYFDNFDWCVETYRWERRHLARPLASS